MTPHHRKCHDCGNVAEHADNVVPAVLCKLCGSQDTRVVRKPIDTKPPVICCHPAEFLVDELRARMMTTRDLAEMIAGPTASEREVVTECLSLNMWIAVWLGDNRDHWRNCYSPDLPEKLSKVWGGSAQLWMNLDASFRDALDRGLPMSRCEESVAWAHQILEADDNPELITNKDSAQ